ncbi:hypothetical protein [Bradyrhizobium canariense]|uniref:hypothetical protein n=1 Tax=Bradyrhizobium canariense TaxID=255045 RepID=UPI000A18C5EB|nr:hypothetical protein [Bradyrhizobium canariense]OSI21190.1 hypothetical protein BST65_32050 [Bradyrhizobium canariense]OSI28956.1 hypothetical protein BST66_27890 [Bradyrhizobium canariense]OSI40042.1 hypothetical protein BSZ20_27345 [Bradyrhizobium canariense]OSI45054.1 hypothetical protein BST67_30305 [Bradyrhizobium canariense]OSI50380.1 hypothetical protein BSZ15_32695 [Bradyrhizobium canariense]
MSRYSDEERERIFTKSIALLQRDEVQQQDQALTPAEALVMEALAQPLESRNDRDRRLIAEQEREFSRQRRAQAIARQSSEARILATVEQRLQTMRGEINELRGDLQSIAAACSHAVEQISGALDDLTAAPAKAADERMQAMFAQLEKKLDEITSRRAGDVDLPILRSSHAN